MANDEVQVVDLEETAVFWRQEVLLSHPVYEAEDTTCDPVHLLKDHLLLELADFLDLEDSEEELVSPASGVSMESGVLIQLVRLDVTLRDLPQVQVKQLTEPGPEDED